jgi:hypothetical protein
VNKIEWTVKVDGKIGTLLDGRRKGENAVSGAEETALDRAKGCCWYENGKVNTYVLLDAKKYGASADGNCYKLTAGEESISGSEKSYPRIAVAMDAICDGDNNSFIRHQEKA